MKKIIFKISILAMLIVVLFANVSLADEEIIIDYSMLSNIDMESEANKYTGYEYLLNISQDNGEIRTSIYKFSTSTDFEFVKNFPINSSEEFSDIPFKYTGPSMKLRIDTSTNMSKTIVDSSKQSIEPETDSVGIKYYTLQEGQYAIRILNNEFASMGNETFTFGPYGNTNDKFTGVVDTDVAHGAEALITRLFLAIGDVFMWAIRGALGSDLSIDNLVFNRYEGTKISFFGGQTSVLNNALIKVVNYWYKALSNFTFVLYIIILVYIGIMIVATSGTPRQDKAKAYFGDWIVGLFILMFLPYYGFPFLFRINDALVEYVGRNSQTFQTYYNLEEKYETTEEIKGGDSYTILVEKIEGELGKAMVEQDETDRTASIALSRSLRSIVTKIANEERNRSGNIDYKTLSKARIALKSQVLNKLGDVYYSARDNGNSPEEAKQIVRSSINANIDFSGIDYSTSEVLHSMVDKLRNSYFDEIISCFEEAYSAKIHVSEVQDDLESVNKDIMGTMRELAGKTLRLVYAIIWLMLIFQLIGLTILYYKRIFTIALLIAIFPIVMLTYCIDKMADGAAQTFSAWMKELLSNIFIQTVHAIIYAVLIDMGLQIYEGGETGWLFLVGAMFLLLPAESILKEIFDLNGSTLSQVGGTFTKFAMGAGALVSLARAGKSEKDKSIKTANDNRMKRLQNSQNRADTKAKQREFRSTYQLDKSIYGGIKGKATLVRDRLKGRDNVKYTAKPGGKPNAMREKMYHGATAARKAYAKAAPKAGRVIRGVRNASAITVGALYAASGGDVQSLAQGAAIAKGLSGKTSDGKKKADLKTELKSAYKRQK